MIMHVAEAGERRGRVVLHLASGHPNEIAIEAAVRIAQAFNSEIESLFVEDLQLYDLASYPFAREISLTRARQRPLSRDDIEREMRLCGQSLQRRVEALARAADVPLRAKVVRDDPVHALAKACAEDGPWNVVALADALAPGQGARLRDLFATVVGTTGLMLVGPNARRTRGQIVAVVETPEHLQPLMRAGERLAGVLGGATSGWTAKCGSHLATSRACGYCIAARIRARRPRWPKSSVDSTADLSSGTSAVSWSPPTATSATSSPRWSARCS